MDGNERKWDPEFFTFITVHFRSPFPELALLLNSISRMNGNGIRLYSRSLPLIHGSLFHR